MGLEVLRIEVNAVRGHKLEIGTIAGHGEEKVVLEG